MKNNQIILNSRPSGFPTADNFKHVSADIGEPANGEMLVRNVYMSVDPYMRGRLNDTKSYVPSFVLGEPLSGGVVGQVVTSNGGKFKEGDYITGMGNWADYQNTDGADWNQVSPALAPLSNYLGVLGMPGMTAYVGLTEVAGLKKGDSVFCSAASGAVGQVVGQIAKNMGCHVSGSAGSQEKIDLIKATCGYDEAFNYKTEADLNAAMKRVCPDGIDVYFENVGGPQLEAVLANLNYKARIAVCGLIASYNAKSMDDMPPGPRNLMMLIGLAAKMEGFIVSFYPEACAKWVEIGAGWMKEGKLNYRETITDGLENAPEAFMGLLRGENVGKALVKVADE